MIILYIHTKPSVEFCVGLGAVNFLFNFLVDFPKCLTYDIEMAGYINSNYPKISSEGANDHPIHPYQVSCRVLYWFSSYEFFN